MDTECTDFRNSSVLSGLLRDSHAAEDTIRFAFGERVFSSGDLQEFPRGWGCGVTLTRHLVCCLVAEPHSQQRSCWSYPRCCWSYPRCCWSYPRCCWSYPRSCIDTPNAKYFYICKDFIRFSVKQQPFLPAPRRQDERQPD